MFRKLRSEVIDEQIEREIQNTEAELKTLQAEFNAATAEQKAQLQAKIDRTNQMLQAQMDAADKWVIETTERVDAKIKAMQKQVAKASEDKKLEMEQRIREIQTDIAQRQKKLKKSMELASTALTP